MPNHMPQQTLFQFRVPHNFRYPPANPSTWPMPPATHGVLALLRTLASFSTGLASSTRSKSASLRPPAFQRAALTPMYTKHVSQTAHPLRLCHSPTPLVVIGLHYPHRRVPLLLLVFTILIAGCPYCYWSSLSSCCYWSSLSSSQGAPAHTCICCRSTPPCLASRCFFSLLSLSICSFISCSRAALASRRAWAAWIASCY